MGRPKSVFNRGVELNKAGYTAQDVPSTRLKITRDRRTDGRANGLTNTPSYRDARTQLETGEIKTEIRGFFLATNHRKTVSF